MKTLTYTIEISDECYDLLLKLGTAGSAEYRDAAFNTVEEYTEDVNNIRMGFTAERFLKRNFGGSFKLMNELYDHGLVELDDMAWHLTYRLTDLGLQMLGNNKNESDN